MILIWLSARLCEWVSFTQWARRDNVKARRSKRDNRQCGHVANVAMASWIRFRMLLSSSLSSSSSSLMASMHLGETPDIIRIFAAWYTQSVLSAIQPDCTQNKVKVQSEDHQYMRTDLTQHIDINSTLTHCVLYQKPSDTVSVCLSVQVFKQRMFSQHFLVRFPNCHECPEASGLANLTTSSPCLLTTNINTKCKLAERSLRSSSSWSLWWLSWLSWPWI